MSSTRHSILPWLILVAGSALTIVLMAIVVRSAPRGDLRERTEARLRDVTPLVLGVTARLTADVTTVERTLPSMAFALTPGQSLDARIPAGAFDGTFTATFSRGAVRQAFIGAYLRGGSLIVKRGEDILLSDHAGAETRLVMTALPVSLGRPVQQLVYEFRTDGTTDAALRAMWQPVTSEVALPLHAEGAPLTGDEIVRGYVLAQRHSCARCHRSGDPEFQTRLEASRPPILGDVGGRVRPSWVRRWLEWPAGVKGGAEMPSLFTASADDAERMDDLAHFLVSMGGPVDLAGAAPDASLIPTGLVTYHRVGCVACHGPLEEAAGVPGLPAGETPAPTGAYTSLGPLAQKTTTPRLAEYLLDPLRTRPSGRMPSSNLEPVEARAVASYLVAREEAAGRAAEDASFTIDPARVARGHTAFAEVGCANCHTLGPDRTPIEPALEATPLEALAPDDGCLADSPPMGVPRYDLKPHERRALRTFLRSLPERRSHNVPIDELAAVVQRLDCVVCHRYHGALGPGPAVTHFFTSAYEADLGDEGRLPPDLTDVGAKLNSTWIREVLEHGGQVRPYLATRMPQFGAHNVDALPGLLAAAAGIAGDLPDEPTCETGMASIGRDLVGAKHFNCIQCHTIAGNDSTGTPGPDLARMVERLRYDNFARWLHNPSLVRPGTRMPTFFVGGRSAFVDKLNGTASRQIAAVWCYLAQGETLPLPEGLLDPSGLALNVTDEPIVFRTYMADAGVRAIACGFPEQVHCAFDPERCAVTAVWEGRFLDAQGAWAARGGSETNPAETRWSAPDASGLALAGDVASSRRFRGYRLDEDRRPVFMYEVVGGDTVVTVTERPVPMAGGGLKRRFELRGEPSTTLVVPRLGALPVDLPDGWRKIDDDRFEITLGADGTASFTLELSW